MPQKVHIGFSCANLREIKKNLKLAGGGDTGQSTYTGIKIRIISDFSAETMHG